VGALIVILLVGLQYAATSAAGSDDFGDAPDPGFPTTLASDGARHAVGTLFLGQRVDIDADGQPTPLASGDNLDGPQNDEEGVTFTSALIQDGVANVEVVASEAGGLLNAWIDFDGNGDWSGGTEQIFVDEALAVGTNNLMVTVPVGATPGITFGRFRVDTVGGLSFTGAALDGEVEDYVLEILPIVPSVGGIGVRIREVLAGLNGDSKVQFVELEVADAAQKAWGPQGAEIVGRAMLRFFDNTGAQTGRFVFPADAPAGGNTILVATSEFAALPGAPTPDFLMPPELVAIAGQVAFVNNPDNTAFNVTVALSYGGSGFLGGTSGGGVPNAAKLPLLNAQSLSMAVPVTFGTCLNASYALPAIP
jgi:hypothetical protein